MKRRYVRIPMVDRFWMRVDQSAGADGCWLWLGSRDKDGYGIIHEPGHGPQRRTHRVSWAIHHNRPIPPTMHVLHRCDNPPCVNPAHLFLGTASENLADARFKGRWHAPKGSANGMSKLTELSVREIRDRVAGGERVTDLARAFGVDQSAVSHAVARRTWRHVT